MQQQREPVSTLRLGLFFVSVSFVASCTVCSEIATLTAYFVAKKVPGPLSIVVCFGIYLRLEAYILVDGKQRENLVSSVCSRSCPVGCKT